MHVLGKFTDELILIVQTGTQTPRELQRLLSIINTNPEYFDDSLSSC